MKKRLFPSNNLKQEQVLGIWESREFVTPVHNLEEAYGFHCIDYDIGKILDCTKFMLNALSASSVGTIQVIKC